MKYSSLKNLQNLMKYISLKKVKKSNEIYFCRESKKL
uniref:Uncharacterized protein n=1 Tax=viral metagenome TaxID=1070528 RepID=A0A6C0AE41_9ZZZZ